MASLVRRSAVYLRTARAAPEVRSENPFISFVKPHVVSYISWIKNLCAFTSLQLRSDWRFQPPPPPPTPIQAGCASPASARFLGSTGSETVTQSSLVIGHSHANQTGRNLQLIRILPPAIIPPSHPPHRCKINYIWGSIPTIGFPVLELHYKGTNPKTTQTS